MTIPKIVFIVPYRNRTQHKYFFSYYMKNVLSGQDNYEIYFSHQCDSRTFNRGATKNIGFLAIKEKYPNDYKDITFVFNDIDTVPFTNLFNYQTNHGIVKHFYGFTYALGGIVALTGADFEATNGYPNFWGWGMEDAVLQKRCEKIGLIIDRTNFYPIGSRDILHLFDGISRIINKDEPIRATNDNGYDGIRTINKLSFTIDNESNNPLDNIHVINNSNILIINITSFVTNVHFEENSFHKYDLREHPSKIMKPSNTLDITNNLDIIDNWSNIPYYPTSNQKNLLINKYGHNTTNEIIEYNLHNSSNPNAQLFPTNTNTNTNINKYSPNYAKLIGVKPRATVSANIRLGGVFR